MKRLLPGPVLRIIIAYLALLGVWFGVFHPILDRASLPLPLPLVEDIDDIGFAVITSLVLYRLVLGRERALKAAEAGRMQADMAARRKTEELAAEAARQALELRTVFRAIPDGIVVYDADGKVVRSNTAAQEFYGFDPLGRRAEEIAAVTSVRWPDGPLAGSDGSRIEDGRPCPAIGQEFLAQSRNGYGDVMATIRSSPLIEDGRVTGVVCVIHDVTERRELLARLAVEHAELVSILQQMPVGVILADGESATALVWNEQVDVILGHPYTPMHLGERRAWIEEPCQAGPPDDVVQGLLEQALRTGQDVRDHEVRFLREDGSCATVVTSAVPIRDFEGHIAGVLATLNDITARMQVEETLRRSNIELKSLSVQLTNSLAAQQKIEDQLRTSNADLERAREDLEQRVEERTLDLARANESLEQRVVERTRELTTLLQVSRKVASTPDLGPLLDLVLSQLDQLMGYSAATILTLHGEDLSVLAYHGPLSASVLHTALIRLSEAPGCERVCRGREPVIWSEQDSASTWAEIYRRYPDLHERELLSQSRAWLGVPMVVQERLIGMLRLEHANPTHFTPHRIELAEAMADLAAIAIENDRLYREAKRMGALDERHRLARELHDSVSQALYGMALGTQAALQMAGPNAGRLSDTLNYVLAQATSAVSDMRALIYELRPELVDRVGLVDALRTHVSSLKPSSSLEIQTVLCPEPDIDLSVKDGLYRIAHQALQNLVQHSGATEAELRLERDESGITLTVKDNGVGFDPEVIPPGHLGVTSMSERTARLNGTIHIDSQPGNGTVIAVRVPLVIYHAG